jgi:peptidoglycan/LPS O-acetylase OafA/YrhL
MGAYRLLLAICVLFSHVEISILNSNPGVVAVISFLLLSGYVMTALIDKHYSGLSKIPAFYADRAMRLLPQYLFYFCLTLLLIAIAKPTSIFLENVSAEGILFNLSVLPLNTQHFIGSRIIPQAWSLGLEFQFYLLIPFILALRARHLAILVSFVIFLFAYEGILKTALYGYSLLPGTLFIFLIGSLIRRTEKYGRLILLGIYISSAILISALYIRPALNVPFNFDVLIGIIIGVPAVWLFSNLKLGRLDDLLGNLSYGVFLNHFLLIWTFSAFSIEIKSSGATMMLVMASITLAWISYWIVERPAIAMRQKFRSNLKPSEKIIVESVLK